VRGLAVQWPAGAEIAPTSAIQCPESEVRLMPRRPEQLSSQHGFEKEAVKRALIDDI
jgi:hypothetical protein